MSGEARFPLMWTLRAQNQSDNPSTWAGSRLVAFRGDADTMCHTTTSARVRAIASLYLLGITAAATGACGSGSHLALTEQLEARKLGSSLRVQFTKAADASNRAVMAVTDDASSAAAREATQATGQVDHDSDALRRLLQQLAYADDMRHLEAFTACFAGYKALDADILSLAVENTNIKAQRLSFGPAHDAANAFRQSLESARRSISAPNCCVDGTIARATAAVLEVEAIEARHIAESDDAAMAQMEAEMAASEAAARTALESLKDKLPASAGRQLAAAGAALERFATTNEELVKLSRRNSNVRSLALSLGRKRVVTAECDDTLRALEESLAKHDFTATR
jgi:hypothetical protein